MDYNNSDRAFEDITARLQVPASPYEPEPVGQPTAKKTLTPRGRKAVIAVVLVAGAVGVTGWQVSQASAGDDSLRAEQVALERQKTELELAEARGEVTARAEEKRAARFTACIEQGKDKVGEFGQSRMDDLIDKCNTAFPPTAAINSVEAASAGTDDSPNLSGWAVLGGGACIGLWMAGRRLASKINDNQ